MGGRSRTTRSSHLYNAGTERVGFSPNRQAFACTQARSTVRCWAGRIKGELHPTKEPLVRRTFLDMDGGVEIIVSISGVAT